MLQSFSKIYLNIVITTCSSTIGSLPFLCFTSLRKWVFQLLKPPNRTIPETAHCCRIKINRTAVVLLILVCGSEMDGHQSSGISIKLCCSGANQDSSMIGQSNNIKKDYSMSSSSNCLQQKYGWGRLGTYEDCSIEKLAKTKHQYIKVFWHLIDICKVNGWAFNRRQCKQLAIQKMFCNFVSSLINLASH